MPEHIEFEPEDPWELNKANYKAYIRMRVLVGLLLVPILVLIANVFFEFMLSGYEKFALAIAMFVLFVFLMRFPKPIQMHRLNEWKGKKTEPIEDFEYRQGALNRLIIPMVVLFTAAIFLMVLLDVTIPYIEYIIAGVVIAIFLAVAFLAAPFKRWRDKSDRNK